MNILHWLVVGVVMVAQPGLSRAQDVGRAQFAKGQSLVERGDFRGAYEAFATGWAATQKPAFLFNMGECARELGETERARAAFAEYLVKEPNGKFAALSRQRLAELGPGLAPAPAVRPAANPAVSTVTPEKKIEKKVEPAPLPPVQTKLPIAKLPTPAPSQPAWTAPTPQAPKQKSFYQKWPFWAGVGVVVVGSATAVWLLNKKGDGPDISLRIAPQ